MSFSKKITTAFCVSIVLLVASVGTTQVNESAEHKAFPIDSIVAARWIDRRNNTISLTFLALYPNGCYSLDRSAGFTATADKKIYVSQSVNVSDGLCTMAIVSQIQDTAILVPELGDYTVIDASTNKTLGRLIINNGEFAWLL